MTANRTPEAAAPLVSVLMSVYNGAPYLEQAIESILKQSFDDFELIIVDDASTDGSAALVTAAAKRDSRVRPYVNASNLGLAGSLNRALGVARGAYIARQDADDVSTPERLSRQLALLASDPSLVLIGSGYRVIDRIGRVLSVEQHPLDDASIRWRLVLHNAFCHSSVIFRADIAARHSLKYDETLRYAQDYDLWSRFLQHGKAANVAEPLVSYRVHDDMERPQMYRQQQNIADRIAIRNLTGLGVALSGQDVARLRESQMGAALPDGEQLRCLFLLLQVMSRFVAVHRGAAAKLAGVRIRLVLDSRFLLAGGASFADAARLAWGFVMLDPFSFAAGFLGACLSRVLAPLRRDRCRRECE